MLRSEANRIRQVEYLVKTKGMKEVLLLGVHGDDEMRKLLVTCPRISLTVVLTERDPAKLSVPEKLRQAAARGRIDRAMRGYSERLFVLISSLEEALELLSDDTTGGYDGVFLGPAFDVSALAGLGHLAVKLVSDGGWLVGFGARSADVRSILAAAVGEKGYHLWREGSWGVQVKRTPNELAPDEQPTDPVDAAIMRHAEPAEPVEAGKPEGSLDTPAGEGEGGSVAGDKPATTASSDAPPRRRTKAAAAA